MTGDRLRRGEGRVQNDRDAARFNAKGCRPAASTQSFCCTERLSRAPVASRPTLRCKRRCGRGVFRVGSFAARGKAEPRATPAFFLLAPGTRHSTTPHFIHPLLLSTILTMTSRCMPLHYRPIWPPESWPAGTVQLAAVDHVPHARSTHRDDSEGCTTMLRSRIGMRLRATVGRGQWD